MLKGLIFLVGGFLTHLMQANGDGGGIDIFSFVNLKDISSTGLLIVGIFFLYKENQRNKEKIDELNKEFKETCIKAISEMTDAVKDLKNAVRNSN